MSNRYKGHHLIAIEIKHWMRLSTKQNRTTAVQNSIEFYRTTFERDANFTKQSTQTHVVHTEWERMWERTKKLLKAIQMNKCENKEGTWMKVCLNHQVNIEGWSQA